MFKYVDQVFFLCLLKYQTVILKLEMSYTTQFFIKKEPFAQRHLEACRYFSKARLSYMANLILTAAVVSILALF